MKYQQTLFILLCSILFFPKSASAQKYAQITRNYPCKIRENGMRIQLFKGEIYEIYQDETVAKLSSSKKGILLKINNITVEVPWGSGTKQTYQYPVSFDTIAFKAIQDQSYNFVTRTERKGKYRFDISNLQINDTVFFASYQAKGVVKLLNKKSIEVDSSYFEKNYYGQVIRMIIPNYPTLGFEWNAIDLPLSTPDHDQSIVSETEQSEENASSKSDSILSMRNVLLVLMLFLFLTILFLVLRGKLFSQPQKKNIVKNPPKRHNELKRREEISNQSNLVLDQDPKPSPIDDTLDEKDVIEPAYETTNEVADTVHEGIKEANVPIESSQESHQQKDSAKIIIERENVKHDVEQEIVVKETPLEYLNKISELEEKVILLEAEKSDLQNQVHENQQKNTNKDASIPEGSNIDNQGIDIGNYAYLCEWFNNYLEKVNNIENKVKAFYNRSVKEDSSAEKTVIEGILYRFYTAKNAIHHFDYWKFIIQELENTNGKVIESNLKAKLDTMDEPDRVAYVQNRLFTEVFTNYFGSTLIMCEEMRNIHRFTNMKFLLAENISTHFDEQAMAFVKAFSGGGERQINYIPLFSTYQEEMIKIRLTTKDEITQPAYYDNIKPQKGEVIGIKKYGFGDTPTDILVGV